MNKNKCQSHVIGTEHIIKYYGRNLSLISFNSIEYSLNQVINWTKSGYTLMSEKFTLYDKLIIMYLYILFNARVGMKTSLFKINAPNFITKRKGSK